MANDNSRNNSNGNGNGNGNGRWTPMLSLTTVFLATVGIMYTALTDEINTLHENIDSAMQANHANIAEKLSEGTKDRYFASNAKADFALRDYRMTRNETNIQLCLDHVKNKQEHK